MSEQRPNASGRTDRARDAAPGPGPADDFVENGSGGAGRDSDEPSLEWLGELKSDADDPELSPVDPAVTQAFEAMLEEGERIERPAPASAPVPAPAPAPFVEPFGGPGDPSMGGQPPMEVTPEFARALAEEGTSVPAPPSPPASPAGDPAYTAPDLNGSGAPEPSVPDAPGVSGTGPQPAVGTGPQPVVGTGAGPQPVVSTGPQPSLDPGSDPLAQGPLGTGPQPALGTGPQYVQPITGSDGPNTGPQPAVNGPGTGPLPAVEGPGTGPQPAVGPNTGPQPAVNGPGTGPHPAVNGPGTGPQPAIDGPGTGPQPAIDGPGTGPQPAVNGPGTGPQPAITGTGPQPVVDGPGFGPGPGTGPQPAVVPVEPGTDTVAIAAASPERPQPYAELGMKEEEYRRVREILGRRPTSSELAIYSVMWSEHCSYKSSRVHLRQFGDKAPKTDALLVGMGENAGVVDIGQGWAVTFKVESHNHPSYVEPYQGAATGVGGIVRDIMSMGARPIAVMDSLRFGPADALDTQRVLPGVVAGVGGYGNSLGLPNIGGETVFDACYAQNPLVNALCVGVLKHDEIQRAIAPGPGNKVILFGATTGPDGIGGASVLASATFDEESHQKRPSVQVGDPFMEKLLIECCLELFAEDLVVGIQDLGAAGVSCATTELAAAGTGGMHVDLDTVPLRDATLRPEEILMSESQERMMAVVTPDKVDRFMEICGRWEIPATVIGTVTDTGRLVMTWRGETIVDIPPGTAADEGPVYERPYAPPHDLGALQSDTPGRLTRPTSGDELRRTVLWLAGSPNLASKTWVTSQYDRYVLGNTVLAMPDNAGVVRVDDESGLGIALSLDGNGRYTRLDPYAGAQLALSEAYRNVAATGARPLAVTNCLNFGSPEDPGVMWQFARAVEGLADACQYLGVPVTGGNVSFYNQTGTTPINPTPVIGVLGVHDDVRRRVNMSLTSDGATIALLGETREEFGGSEWAHVVYGHLGGLPPLVDLKAESALAGVMIQAARDGLVTAVHDLSDGGLSQTLVESCLRGGLGARITLPGDPFVSLFSESVARAMVAVSPGAEARLAALCEAAGVPVTQIGVAGGDALSVTGRGAEGEQQELFSIPLAELREAHERMLPSYAN
ncbi:phosphoribosylformylglycinamidine synthase subunit PurL [Actinomadura sp. NEAU-AAG7]|uniref:phosphoribosylformylglycinamidine synthase subunit PurL n=1 Tax=Actinomadura sp. NEAU-AAG7 TaxID=2839640 RepID=UPI0027E134DC|nr:phosphoribosylformylglycinamidine synthase subunit PurL [Actinomadura sp. NEAU-AAG7]